MCLQFPASGAIVPGAPTAGRQRRVNAPPGRSGSQVIRIIATTACPLLTIPGMYAEHRYNVLVNNNQGICKSKWSDRRCSANYGSFTSDSDREYAARPMNE